MNDNDDVSLNSGVPESSVRIGDGDTFTLSTNHSAGEHAPCPAKEFGSLPDNYFNTKKPTRFKSGDKVVPRLTPVDEELPTGHIGPRQIIELTPLTIEKVTRSNIENLKLKFVGKPGIYPASFFTHAEVVRNFRELCLAEIHGAAIRFQSIRNIPGVYRTGVGPASPVIVIRDDLSVVYVDSKRLETESWQRFRSSKVWRTTMPVPDRIIP